MMWVSVLEISTMTGGDANFHLHKSETESTDTSPSLFALFISFTSTESKQIDLTNQYADKLVTKQEQWRGRRKPSKNVFSFSPKIVGEVMENR